jgi:hypothetical protein
MKYVIEMGSGALICIPNFIKIGSGIQKLNREYTDSVVISKAYFYFLKTWIIG